MIALRYLDPTVRSFDHSLTGWLLSELPSASALKFATAYFEGSVLDWLEAALEDLVARGGSVQAVIGSNEGQTRRADLQRLLTVLAADARSTLHVEYAEGGNFHPKVFVIESGSHVAALIGSANLTASGSIVNVEAGVVLSTDEPGPPPEAPLDAVVASVSHGAHPNMFRVESLDDLHRLEGMGIIGRIVPSSPLNLTQDQADDQRLRRQQAGVRRRSGVVGIPRKRRSRLGPDALAPRQATSAEQTGRGDLYGLRFAPNDLKATGTREFSVSGSMRAWAEQVLGRPIAQGEGKLFDIALEGRLAASPMSIVRTPDRGRLWAAGGSGGTHQDLRLVLGNRLRAGLEDQAIRLTGLEVPGGSIGVFQLPDDPRFVPARLTVFLPTDPEFPAVESLLAVGGRERKPHFHVRSLREMPFWP